MISALFIFILVDEELIPAAAGNDYQYDIPVKQNSPWPLFRRTSSNNGFSPIVPLFTGMDLWVFKTEKGIFHAPVIDDDGTVYIGSADTRFYAINPAGSEKWRFRTGEIIDSSALIAADGTIYVPAGDGYIYALSPDGAEKGRFRAHGTHGYITWWEGHITMNRDGCLLAGNDDRMMYAIRPDGGEEWTFRALDQIWSCPSTGTDDGLFFGSNDFTFRKVDSEGKLEWFSPTLGPVASSPVLDAARNLVVVGSFDGFLHAFDAKKGNKLWKFPAQDHIYSSPAISGDGTIYIGGTDCSLYAVNPENGALKWAFDTLEPIRSSPAVDGMGNIYFGCGDGRLYALKKNGKKWWSFDTSTGDRNDLNGSPAIGEKGIVIGGESGAVYFIPFDYCLTHADERCDCSPEEELPQQGSLLYYMTPGGNSVETIQVPQFPTSIQTFRLIVRKNGDTERARIWSKGLAVTATPEFKKRIEISADGRFVSLIPEQPLKMDEQYKIKIEGRYLLGGVRVGNRLFGGYIGGRFSGDFEFETCKPTGSGLALEITSDYSSVVLMRHLAVPQPSMLATFNQIGFDSYNYLLAPVVIDSIAEKLILLAVEGTPGLYPSQYVDTKSIFPLNGGFKDSYFSLWSRGFTLDVTGVSIKLDEFRINGILHPDLFSDPLNIYTEATCSNIEFFGPVLNVLGLCHPSTNKLIANATGGFEPHDGEEGFRLADLEVDTLIVESTGGIYGGGFIKALFKPNSIPAESQLPVILLIDTKLVEAEDLDYGEAIEKIPDGSGMLGAVELHLKQGYNPYGKKAVVIVNLYPLYHEIL